MIRVEDYVKYKLRRPNPPHIFLEHKEEGWERCQGVTPKLSPD